MHKMAIMTFLMKYEVYFNMKCTLERILNLILILSANLTKWSKTLHSPSATADDLFECVSLFCGLGA